jgi:TIR domain
MGFLLVHDHDVFVSYVHINDLPWEGNAAVGLNPPSGWVTRFVRHLRERLQEKIGRPEVFEFCFDQTHLRANHNLTAEIATHLRASALLIAIESPGYVASIWCRDEARPFTLPCGSALGNRLFVVQKEPLDHDEPPLAELSGRRNIRFWTFDEHKRERLLS